MGLNKQQEKFKDSGSEAFASIHESVAEGTEDYFGRFRRRIYVTQKPYSPFLDSFQKIYFN
jgi:hypothetical protein